MTPKARDIAGVVVSDTKATRAPRLTCWSTWALRLATWDGLLPLVVFYVPLALDAVAPHPPRGPDRLRELVGLGVAVGLFSLRLAAGRRELSAAGAPWRRVVFVVGLFPLALAELVYMLIVNNPDIAEPPWSTCGLLMAVYFSAMAVAFLPRRPGVAGGVARAARRKKDPVT